MERLAEDEANQYQCPSDDSLRPLYDQTATSVLLSLQINGRVIQQRNFESNTVSSKTRRRCAMSRVGVSGH